MSTCVTYCALNFFFSHFHAKRGNAVLAAPAARRQTRRWDIARCSDAGAWERGEKGRDWVLSCHRRPASEVPALNRRRPARTRL